MSPVAERIAEKPVHGLVVHRPFGAVDDSLKEKVGLFELVEEEVVVLRKLQFRQAVLCHHLRAKHVESGEEPASARTLLVGYPLARHAVGEMRVESVFCIRVCGELVDCVCAYGVAQRACGGRPVVSGFEPGHHLGRDAAVGGEGDERHRSHSGNGYGSQESVGHFLWVVFCFLGLSLLFPPQR